MSRYWRTARIFLLQRILHTSDSPHAVALGTGLATFVAFTPLIGIQTIIAVGLAALFKANKAVCIPIVWVTNIFTIAPIYGACLALGRAIMGRTTGVESAAILSELEQQNTASIFDAEFWVGLYDRIYTLGVDLWVGCLVVGVLGGFVSYALTRWGVTTYRERRRLRLLRRNLLRAQRGEKITRRSEPV